MFFGGNGIAAFCKKEFFGVTYPLYVPYFVKLWG
jgi:hypothetical protein